MVDHSAEPWYPTAAYLYVLHLDGLALAWEYLRRHPDYRLDWLRRHRRPAQDAGAARSVFPGGPPAVGVRPAGPGERLDPGLTEPCAARPSGAHCDYFSLAQDRAGLNPHSCTEAVRPCCKQSWSSTRTATRCPMLTVHSWRRSRRIKTIFAMHRSQSVLALEDAT